MKKIIRLTEGDINRIVKRVISEQEQSNTNSYRKYLEEKRGTILKDCDNLFDEINSDKFKGENFCNVFLGKDSDVTDVTRLNNMLDKINRQMGSNAKICDICDRSKTNIKDVKDTFVHALNSKWI